MNSLHALTICILVAFAIYSAQAIVAASRDRLQAMRNYYPVKPAAAIVSKYSETGELFTSWRKTDRAPRDLVALAMRSEKAQKWIQ